MRGLRGGEERREENIFYVKKIKMSYVQLKGKENANIKGKIFE